MKRFGILFGLVVIPGFVLGGCSSAMEYTSSLSRSEALRIGATVTPEAERRRIIENMKEMRASHLARAMAEIEAR